MSTKTDNREALKTFRVSYTEGWGDWGEEFENGDPICPDSIASGFFNCSAEIDEDGDVVFDTGHVADADQLDRLVSSLRESGNISSDSEVLS